MLRSLRERRKLRDLTHLGEVTELADHFVWNKMA